MSLGKFVGLGLIAMLGWKYQGAAAKQLSGLTSMVPEAKTTTRMGSFKSQLHLYISEENMTGSGPALPEDLPTWLDENFSSTDEIPAGTDYFGTRYEPFEEDGWLGVRSAGPDKTFRTDDDIIARIYKI